MAEKITEQEYRALGELRYLIRRFVQEGDVKAKQAGLEPQQYLLLLAIRGLPRKRPSPSARWRIVFRCATTVPWS